MGRWRQRGVGLARGLVLLIAAVICLAGLIVVLLRTTWGLDKARALIVSQANRYLSATLEIDRLSGSLLRGVVLEGVRLTREGRTLVSIDRVEVDYRVRELTENGTTIRRLRLTHPVVSAGRDADGRWDVAALVRQDQPDRNTPRRPIRIEALQVDDADVTLRTPVSVGAARIPSRFTGLDADLRLSSDPQGWSLDFANGSFTGSAPDLHVISLTGLLGNADAGWRFNRLRVVTDRSDLTVTGTTDRRVSPSTVGLTFSAPRLAFQEWAGVLGGLRNIAVETALEATLDGPPSALSTVLSLRSTGGDIRATVQLDSSVPGWHARGSASVARLNLARWLNRPDRPSDITGDATLDVDLQLGGHFPVGRFTFKGPHAGYLEYEADDVTAEGVLTPTDVQLARATATAYGANVQLRPSTMAIDAPYGFRFVGTAAGVDLRQVPRSVPVPHVESTLAFDFDAAGRFAEPYLTGHATFAESVFLGATIAAGAQGAIDTSVTPFTYEGNGGLRDIDLHRFGRDLDIAWMTEPRYAGLVSGQFSVRGAGSDLPTMTLEGGGRLDRASLFEGTLADMDVHVSIAAGSLQATFDGELASIDPSIPMEDALYSARLSGHARGRAAVRDLMVRSPQLEDYTLDATLDVRNSRVRGVDVTTGRVEAGLDAGTMRIARLSTAGPGADVEASGTLELDGVRSSDLTYAITRSDLHTLRDLIGADVQGQAVTRGRMTGPVGLLRFTGQGSVTQLAGAGAEARSATADYDVTVPPDDPSKARGTLTARLTGVMLNGRPVQLVTGDVHYDAGALRGTVSGTIRDGLTARLTAALLLDAAARTATIDALDLDVQRSSWRLGASPARVAWTDTGVNIASLDLVDSAGQQHVTAAGTWDTRGGGAMRVAMQSVRLESLLLDDDLLARYGGVVDGTGVIGGTADHPTVTSDFRISAGRIRRLAYEAFGGHVEYRDDGLHLEVRLDQAPGVWLTGSGVVPLSVFDRSKPAEPLRLAVKSSDISLTLVEGVSDIVRNVTGRMRLDVTVVGTSSDPHFSGRVEVADASFDVVASGARYRNGRLALQLATDRVAVDLLHVEDEEGHPLEVTGSLGTHELRVGDLAVTVSARGFEVLRNEYGRVDIDAQLNLSGEFESPKLTGRLTVTGGALNVDRILDRTLFQPYATQASVQPVDIDPIVALNPWQRMGMDLELHVPGTLRMVGENVQVSPGTPLGLGNINLRAFGDLYLYKDPAQPMYVNGSFDSLSGTYVFQGRRFDLDPVSSINFRGDLNPELYVTVNRQISGVETRVSIVGPLAQPELRLASTPPLDPSDILSLIVFNTSTNELSALQQQQLAVRAGTLAAGFIAAPMVSALERTLGIDTLEIEPGADIRGGPRVTVGNEIAPGLVARFSRQFGEGDYDEATLEYYLSRILRIRATFSDAGTLTARSPFRRVERAGIDLLLFFSF